MRAILSRTHRRVQELPQSIVDARWCDGSELVHSITNEEVHPGPLPDWLLDHVKRQSTDPLPNSEGGPSRILILYPGEQARRESLERLADEGLVIDRTLHHTIDSLEKSLLADLRIAKNSIDVRRLEFDIEYRLCRGCY